VAMDDVEPASRQYELEVRAHPHGDTDPVAGSDRKRRPDCDQAVRDRLSARKAA
jgi:hypothetical protein